jgi:hypothetical protein
VRVRILPEAPASWPACFISFVAGRSGSVIYGQNGLGRAVQFRIRPHPTTATDTYMQMLLRAGAEPVIDY